MEIKKAMTKADIEFCRQVILEFRPNLDEKHFVDQILAMIKNEAFELVYIPAEDSTKAAAFIGFRTMQLLRTGSIIYIDDLFTLPEARGKGYAGALLDYVKRQAETAEIASVHLDSGYMLHDAHRLYLNKGYVLACNHFAKKIA